MTEEAIDTAADIIANNAPLDHGLLQRACILSAVALAEHHCGEDWQDILQKQVDEAVETVRRC